MKSFLESSQIMLNMIKNQRLDATTLNIHKMWFDKKKNPNLSLSVQDILKNKRIKKYVKKAKV